MLFAGALSTVFMVTPAFHFPAAAADQTVNVDTSGPFVRLDGRMTDLSSGSKLALHRVDDHRFVLVGENYASHLYDRVSGAVTPLVPEVRAFPTNGALVLLLLSRVVCDIDPERPALRVLDSAAPWVSPLTFDGSRLISKTNDSLRVVRTGRPVQVLPLPEGFFVPHGDQVVRGDRVIIVREGPLRGATRSLDGRTWEKPVAWSLEVAVFDVGSGAFTPLGKVPGRWQYVGMNCCSGWEPSTWISWTDAATAREVLHADAPRAGYELMTGQPSAVVDEWNEVITWDGPELRRLSEGK